MFVREFTPQDAERLSQLIVQNLRRVNIRDYSREAIEALAPFYTPEKIIESAGHRLTLVCTMGNEIVGTASLDGERVRDVFVELSLHKRGIGKRLVLAIEDRARRQRIKKVFLLSGLSAQGFYQKLGYTVVRRFDNDPDGIPLPVVHMEKGLQENSPAGWATLLLWVLASALGGGMGFALGFAVSETLSDFVGRTGRDLLLFGIFGGLVGVAQWLVLRTRIADAGWWMLASFLAWVVIGVFAHPLEQILSLAIAPAVAGAVVGVLQALVLRRHVRRFGFWVVASTIGWALGWSVAGASDGVVALVVRDEIVGYVVLYAIIATVAGLITGPALVLLLGQSQ